ncbi:MAG: 23S rRNA (pseudouridine(1915)-N(3))-methyltransferase RlmH [Deltaproteobacteria bacterium]|nr:23S rRNA (pseudouridine(1915)-N(3))-methyltransferase RlmH [Deltaproteobacteria bacterium]
MKIVVVTVSRGRTPWADEGFETYAKRIRRWLPLEEVRVRPASGADPVAARAEEGRTVLALLRPGDRVVCLDERGRFLDTPGFRDLVDRAGIEGRHRLLFLVGGPFGHDPGVRERADLVLSLSGLVFNHQVARVVLAEQVYRALSSLHGDPYAH